MPDYRYSTQRPLSSERCFRLPHLLFQCVLLTYAVFHAWRVFPGVVRENQPVEWAQAVLLGLAALLHGLHGLQSAARHERAAHYGLLLFFMSLMMREIDFYRLHSWGLLVLVEKGLRLWVALTWVFWLTTYRRALYPLAQRWRTGLAAHGVRLLMAGCILYALSWPFDKNIMAWPKGHAMLFEEWLQLLGAWMLFLSAAAWGTRRPWPGISCRSAA